MSWARYGRLALTLITSMSSGCTFYTACPTGNNNPPPTNTGGTNGGGGTGNNLGGAEPMGMWVPAVSNLNELESECGNMSYLAVKPGEDKLIASIALRGLWQSTDGGDSWTAMGQGMDSDKIANRGNQILFDPTDATAFWEVGRYNGTGVFETVDDGETFKAVGMLQNNDYLTVDFADPQRLTMLASGHEVPHQLFRTVDGGMSFEQLGDRIPSAQKVCPFPVLIDTNTYLLGCGTYGGGKESILRSTDAGETWDVVAEGRGGVAPLFASDGSIYWAGEGAAGIVRSTDQGETWSTGLGVGLIGQVPPVELPDGSIAAVGGNHVVVSRDEGETWTLASPPLPYAVTGLLYSEQRKAFYVWHFTCEVGPVPDDVIVRYDFDYDN